MESQKTSNTDGPALVEDLLKRCESLLVELEAFRDFILDARAGMGTAEHAVDIKHFRGPVQAELSSLQKVRISFRLLETALFLTIP